jgi:hypothetical protein
MSNPLHLAPNDERMLREVIDYCPDQEEEEQFYSIAFKEMLERGRALSPKQRSWLQDVHERIIGTPNYQNLVSEGRAPREREVELLVKDRPLKPPPGRTEP